MLSEDTEEELVALEFDFEGSDERAGFIEDASEDDFWFNDELSSKEAFSTLPEVKFDEELLPDDKTDEELLLTAALAKVDCT